MEKKIFYIYLKIKYGLLIHMDIVKITNVMEVLMLSKIHKIYSLLMMVNNYYNKYNFLYKNIHIYI